MKISKLFHWLYFIVMMLPILSIPIFAIYSHRHTIDTYSVSRDEPNYNVFQHVFNGKPNGYEDIVIEDVNTYGFDNNSLYVSSSGEGYIEFSNDIVALEDDVIFYCFNSSSDNDDSALDVYFVNDDADFNVVSLSLNENVSTYYDVFSINGDFTDKSISFYFNPLSSDIYYFSNVMIFNLTNIYGSGNEPSADTFKSLLVDNYYSYGLTDFYAVTRSVTYNDTDIGSQFTYDVYNVVDKYFNYDNVFNFSQLYDWLNLTFFNGGASLGFFIFWHLLIYWLLTSILWLVFDVLMYVPQLVHRWLDKASLS